MDIVESVYRELIEAVNYLSPEEIAQVERAFEYACLAHKTVFRKSGEPYIIHPLTVAAVLARMRMDVATLSAALLHDVLEDSKSVTPGEVEEEFGPQVLELVRGLTKLDMDRVRAFFGADPTYDQIEEASLVNLFMAMADDLRVIVIKLCDRLHNMLTIGALKPQRQLEIARETLELFVPVSARLGIWLIKKQLEDLSLEVIELEAYTEIKEIMQARSQLLKRDLEDTLSHLRTRLADDGIGAEVGALPEHIYGIYRHIKMHGWQSARAYDGLRIHLVVDTVPQCYAALGSVHSLWKPIPGRFVDYIAAPKDGLYRSLHIAVIGLRGCPLEVRIRTHQMHHLSEYGVVAYLQHPPDGMWVSQPRPQVAWLKQLKEWPDDDPVTFLELFKSQIAPDHVRVFTPKGDVMELPMGATPVDFAYAVHTEVGHSCHKALVNGRFVPLNTPLCDGDQVEIVKSNAPRPDRAWLDRDLGYVGNPVTLKHIRRWFARQPEVMSVEQGYDLIEKEILCWGGCAGWTEDEITLLAGWRGMSVEELCLRVGRGEISASDLAAFVLCEVLGWAEGHVQPVTLEVNAVDRPGLLLDACRIVADDDVNMEAVSAWSSDEQGLACVHLTLAAKTVAQVVRITHRLERMRSVIQVRRIEL